MSGQPRILGIYSLNRSTEVGVGGTAKEYVQKTYWFARRLDDDAYEVQPLNANHIPSGIRNILSKKDFVTGYVPEPGYYEKKTLPHVQSLKKKLEMGEKHLREGCLDEAEKVFCKAILLDENSCEANVGLGEVYCRTQDHKKLCEVLRRILNLDEVFKEEQRHLFNRFGIDLRKAGYRPEAIAYYQRAIAFSPDDENLHFNIARVHFEAGDLGDCTEHLHTALGINPHFAEAGDFLRYLESSSVVSGTDGPPSGKPHGKDPARSTEGDI
ncbi:MAG: tetratricopeptide repeat protein [Desulfovibrio sp.]|nr:tetratricopeptide repeat protein [Desulfovibrio sp.]